MGKVKPNRHHNVYIIELSGEVLKERKFTKANPNHGPSKPCVYVGLTGLTPKERFSNHKRGYKSNRYVYRYGVKLLPRLYAHLNPMSYEDGKRMESRLADELRRKGYGVWQS